MDKKTARLQDNIPPQIYSWKSCLLDYQSTWQLSYIPGGLLLLAVPVSVAPLLLASSSRPPVFFPLGPGSASNSVFATEALFSSEHGTQLRWLLRSFYNCLRQIVVQVWWCVYPGERSPTPQRCPSCHHGEELF